MIRKFTATKISIDRSMLRYPLFRRITVRAFVALELAQPEVEGPEVSVFLHTAEARPADRRRRTPLPSAPIR